MDESKNDRNGMPLELRKQLLIAQGAMYRSGIKNSRQKVKAGLEADTLARSALKHIGLAALSAWRNRSGAVAASLPAIVPMVIGGVSKLWQQPKLKPVVRGIAIAGAVASAVALLAKWASKKAKAAQADADPEDAAPADTGPLDPLSSEAQ